MFYKCCPPSQFPNKSVFQERDYVFCQSIKRTDNLGDVLHPSISVSVRRILCDLHHLFYPKPFQIKYQNPDHLHCSNGGWEIFIFISVTGRSRVGRIKLAGWQSPSYLRLDLMTLGPDGVFWLSPGRSLTLSIYLWHPICTDSLLAKIFVFTICGENIVAKIRAWPPDNEADGREEWH